MLSVEKTPYEEIWLYSLMGHTYGWLDLAGGELLSSCEVTVTDKDGETLTGLTITDAQLSNGNKEVKFLCKGGTAGTLYYCHAKAVTNKNQKLDDTIEVSVVAMKSS